MEGSLFGVMTKFHSFGFLFPGAICSFCISSRIWFSIFDSSWSFCFPFVLRFRGVMSFDPMGLPRFESVLDSYAFCPSVISTYAGTFAAGICDFVTFFVSTNASGN